MSSETIFDRVREKPFRPFRMRTSDGEHYDIHHPEMIKLMKQRIILFFYDGDRSDEGWVSAERSVTVSPLHVVSLEDVPERRAKPRRAG